MAAPVTRSTISPDEERRIRNRVHALSDFSVPLDQWETDAIADELMALGDPDLCRELVYAVFHRSRIEGARDLACRFRDHFPDDTRLASLAKTIRPTGATLGADIAPLDRRPDTQWLIDHAHEYPGEWLVMGEGKLWAHHPDLDEARRQARAAGLTQRLFVHWVPARPELPDAD